MFQPTIRELFLLCSQLTLKLLKIIGHSLKLEVNDFGNVGTSLHFSTPVWTAGPSTDCKGSPEYGEGCWLQLDYNAPALLPSPPT